VINGGHVILYSRDAEADRAFFRDVLRYPHVDAGDGWLIFKAPTVAELSERGVEFTGPASDQGWGLLTSIRLPSGGQLGLYQPRHPIAHSLPH
jgi:catechol 2,3-dioxygenase-like lactoylglutathione lyase family enzyme